MDSKGFAPASTAIAGTALARLGMLTLDGNHLTPPPYSGLLAWKRVEEDRDWLMAGGTNPPEREGEKPRNAEGTWLTIGLQFSGESIRIGDSVLMLSNPRLTLDHG